ncbi:PREDICTED: uncharacterized protein LOC106111917 [Papilio polytes]|uniref:uncharacterized protein LOC106111917 n=1 Tax=Papilio polytes TaxID=76194 RepID=UPI0006760ECE|nr:PREDICTED: uncharacterized protein LOC106111917 [Papilio polytes]
MTDNNNSKSAAPPAGPPPPPPADLGDSMDSQPDFSFNLELSRNQHEQYDLQFDEADIAQVTPAVTIVVDEVVGDNFEDEVCFFVYKFCYKIHIRHAFISCSDCFSMFLLLGTRC